MNHVLKKPWWGGRGQSAAALLNRVLRRGWHKILNAMQRHAECAGDFTDYYDLIETPEKHTGYDGSNVWHFIRHKICFQVGDHLPLSQLRAATTWSCGREGLGFRI